MRCWHLPPGTVPHDRTLREVARFLWRGGVLLAPTETYYGLLARADLDEAVARVYWLKERPWAKPLPLLVSDVAVARNLAPAAPPELERLAAVFWPGPLTLVLPASVERADGTGTWPDGIVSATGGIAVRQSAHPVAAALARFVRIPLTATSANVSGAPPARRLEDVQLERLVEGVIDAGPTPGGPPSTVLDLCHEPRILRAGAVETGAIEKVLGRRLV